MAKKAAPRDKFSIVKKLREENKSNDIFEIMLSNLTFEEIIALKLELVSKSVGSNLYGLPLWRSLSFIVKDAMLRYALASTQSKTKAIQFLGLDSKTFYRYLTNYGLRDYFNDPKGNDNNESNNRGSTKKDLS
jgi:hypothetical protein